MTQILLLHSQPGAMSTLADALCEQGIQATQSQDLPGPTAVAAYECLVAEDALIDARLSEYARIVPVMIIAGNATVSAAVSAMRRGAADYVEADTDPQYLVAAVERARAHPVHLPAQTLEQFPMVGSSPAMLELKQRISKVAPTDSTVLILGQSGTGKELVARALHAASRRASAPLITLNCATVPHNLIEAELFGMERYEGATTQHRGLIDAAEGGTLFLDEIAELPAPAQARLLRVLHGENRRVGSSATQPADVRVIAATHRNLLELAKGGSFREDLYYRLNVVSLEIPPLQHRRQDVLEIATWLLQRTASRLNKTGLAFAREAERAMLEYHWPGNVRELENAVERAVILADNDGKISQSLLAIEPSQSTHFAPDAAVEGDQTSLEDYFVRFVLDNQEQYTETELAQKLGISRKSLWERRQRLNIPRKKTRKRGPRRDDMAAS